MIWTKGNYKHGEGGIITSWIVSDLSWDWMCSVRTSRIQFKRSANIKQ